MSNPVSWAVKKARELNNTIWHAPLSELSRRKIFLIKQARILFMAGRNSLNDRVELRASALTFYTLLSMIPVIAIAFAIAKGFGLDQNLESVITSSKLREELRVWKFPGRLPASGKMPGLTRIVFRSKQIKLRQQ